MSLKRVSILGATGSVGRSTAAVILAQPELFDVQVVTANSKAQELAALAIKLNARMAVVSDESAYDELKQALAGTGIEPAAGRPALLDAAGMSCDFVMAAIVGFDGLEPILRAIEAGANIGLANKEPLVAAGPQVMEAVRKHGVKLLPVDSEHNAVFQVFDERQRAAIKRILLTASGGPFRTWSPEQMEKATQAQAVAHPNWSMGRKISVDSASMMNKALEVIEAHYLFDLPGEQIEVMIHPQSIIHSMVEYMDGSILAQMGAPDMQTPVAYCLGWPDRIASPGQKLSFNQALSLDLEPVDKAKFPALSLAYDCLEEGQAACVAFNAANEVAVEAFLEGGIGFMDIVRTVGHILEKTGSGSLKTVADIILFNKTVRDETLCYIKKIGESKKEVHAA